MLQLDASLCPVASRRLVPPHQVEPLDRIMTLRQVPPTNNPRLELPPRARVGLNRGLAPPLYPGCGSQPRLRPPAIVKCGQGPDGTDPHMESPKRRSTELRPVTSAFCRRKSLHLSYACEAWQMARNRRFVPTPCKQVGLSRRRGRASNCSVSCSSENGVMSSVGTRLPPNASANRPEDATWEREPGG